MQWNFTSTESLGDIMNKVFTYILIVLTVFLLLTSCRAEVGSIQSDVAYTSDATDTESVTIDSKPSQFTEDTSIIETTSIPEELPEGLYYYVPSLPKIEDFSGTEYEDYEYPFASVESAVLKHNGTETEISPDDPRIIRLLNFIMYGEQDGQTHWRQGYVFEDEINEYISSNAPMLVVNFNNTPSNNVVEATPKIIISGNQYFIFKDEDSLNFFGEKVIAEQLFAYEGLFQKEAEQPIVDKLEKISWEEQWSNPDYYWLDLIEYAGFLTE